MNNKGLCLAEILLYFIFSSMKFNQKLRGVQYCGVIRTPFNYSGIPVNLSNHPEDGHMTGRNMSMTVIQ